MLDFGIWWLDAHDMETLSIEALQDVDVASPQDLKPLAKTLDNIMKPSQALNDPHDVYNSWSCAQFNAKVWRIILRRLAPLSFWNKLIKTKKRQVGSRINLNLNLKINFLKVGSIPYENVYKYPITSSFFIVNFGKQLAELMKISLRRSSV